jgi:hypothetical protein
MPLLSLDTRRTVMLALLVAGCGGARETTPAERATNSLATVDERLIRASIMDDDLAVDIPVDGLVGTPWSGRLAVQLANVATGEVVVVGHATVAFTQAEAVVWHRVVFRGAARGLERVAAGPMILNWRLRADEDDDLYGHRSLYSALGNLDVQLRGPTELAATGTSPMRVVVRDPSTRAPLEGVDVVAVLETAPATEGGPPVAHPLFSGRTDAHGELASAVALPDGTTGGTLRVTVSQDGVQVWTTRTVTRRTDDQLYLGSDKTMYQPGQNVHLRLLALAGPDRLAVADTEVVFEARDARGNKVFRQSTRTDAFGVAATIVPTDTRVNEGDWKFSAQLAGRQTQLQLPVRAYVLPKLRVAVSGDRTFALPGDVLRGRVAANYLFGEPVADAAVTVEVRTSSGVPVGSFYGRTDAQGGYAFELLVPESLRTDALEESGDTLFVSATVVDRAEQTEQGQSTLPLAAAPLRIQVIGDGGLAPGVESLVYVVVTDAVGRPLVADVSVAGDADASLVTNTSGVAELRLTPTSESVSLDLTATDGAGRSHARVVSLGATGDTRLRVATDKAIYRAGDLARLHVTAAAGIDRVFLDVYRGATGVLSTSLALTSTGADVELPITAELGGLLVVDAFASSAEGEPLRAGRALLVERDDNLQVALAADRDTYGPGDTAQIDVRLTDAAGAPRVGSVGLTVVDEAVFALGGEPTTSLRSSFGLDSRVLPSSVNVAGRGADALLNERDPVGREQLARLLFASAGDVHGPSFDYDSLAVELPQVVNSLTQKLAVDGQRYLEGLLPFVESGALSATNIDRHVRLAHLVDPFGRRYRMTVEGTDPWSTVLVITSDGPDELRGTADDVTTRVWMSWLFYGGYYGGGPMAGPGFAEGDGMRADGATGATPPTADPGAATQPRVRRDFRETAFVNPMLITDASGRATVTVPLADSITTWRVSADGSTADGRVGAAREQLRTFQPFFVDFSLPVRLTSGDELDVPAIVYNYTAEPQRVGVTLDGGDWFELLGSAAQAVDLGPSEVRAVRFRIRITLAGAHELTMHGSAGTLGDVIVRGVQVLPEGQADDQTFSGVIDASALGRSLVVDLPADTVPGGGSLELMVTPGFAAEAVQGISALMKEPNGCFEQTTSTAWPNTLVAKYLDATGGFTPETRAEAIALITRGYQRLLTFESPTGGFNWWGDSDPGNRILSAVMLWHLKDMDGLIETDSQVRDRTLAWLVAQQQADGSWASGDMLHAGNEVLGTDDARTTAFIAWALAHTGWADDSVLRAADWLRTHLPATDDLYANALVANALALADPAGTTTTEVFGRLDGLRVDLGADEGTLWPTETPSWTGTGGDTAAIETTGLVAYGLMQAGVYPDDVAGAMRFILANKDAVGTWYNTQATMNALRALSAGLGGGAGDADGTLVVTIGGVEAARVVVDASNRDLYRRFDLSSLVRTGANDVQLAFVGSGQLSYRVSRRAYRPALPPTEGPLSLTVNFDTTSVAVGSPVTVTARAHDGEAAGSRDQVIVRVGRAPGFEPRTEDLDAIVARGLASRYEVRAEDVTFYLMGLAAGETRELSFRLVPSLPVDATAPASTIYAYYEPSLRQTLPAERFVATR